MNAPPPPPFALFICAFRKYFRPNKAQIRTLHRQENPALTGSDCLCLEVMSILDITLFYKSDLNPHTFETAGK